MGLFGRRKSNEADFNTKIKEMAREFVDLYTKTAGVPFDKTTELEKQILATYSFGMIDGLRQNEKINITPNQVGDGIVDVLVSVFKYSAAQADSFFNSMVLDLQSGDPRNTSYAIIHRGLDGYFGWQKNKDAVVRDILQIVNLLKG